MKKLLVPLLCVLLALSACSATVPAASPVPMPSESAAAETPAPAERPVMNIAALKGPTAMGMAVLMETGEMGTSKVDYSFAVTGAVDEIAPLLLQGKADVAAVPANLAAVLYQNTGGKIKVMAVNTLGVLYMLEKGNTVNSIADLKGKTVVLSGKGAVPDYTLQYLLDKNGLSLADVTVEYKSEHAEVVSAMAQNPGVIGLLPQPFVTTAQLQNPELRVCLDMNAEWDKLGLDSTLIMGVLVGRTEYLEENADTVAQFLQEYAVSVEQVNADPKNAGALLEKFDVFPANVAEKAIPLCNIVCITGDSMQKQLLGYLKTLFDQKPESVGGALPDDAFYYKP